IVAAALQPPHPLVEARQRAQYDHRRRLAETLQRGDDRQPVDAARKHAIEDDDIPALVRGEVEPACAVTNQTSRVTGLLETVTDMASGVRFLLYDRTAHARPTSETVLMRKRLPR